MEVDIMTDLYIYEYDSVGDVGFQIHEDHEINSELAWTQQQLEEKECQVQPL